MNLHWTICERLGPFCSTVATGHVIWTNSHNATVVTFDVVWKQTNSSSKIELLQGLLRFGTHTCVREHVDLMARAPILLARSTAGFVGFD